MRLNKEDIKERWGGRGGGGVTNHTVKWRTLENYSAENGRVTYGTQQFFQHG
jgi:hypothetical protein